MKRRGQIWVVISPSRPPVQDTCTCAHTYTHTHKFPSVIMFSMALPNTYTQSILKPRSHPARTECLCGLRLLSFCRAATAKISLCFTVPPSAQEKQAKNRKNRRCLGWWGWCYFCSQVMRGVLRESRALLSSHTLIRTCAACSVSPFSLLQQMNMLGWYGCNGYSKLREKTICTWLCFLLIQTCKAKVLLGSCV